MERHKCRLCPRSFSNGRALGGHMKAHLASHPLPPETTSATQQQQQQQQLRFGAESASSSSSREELELTKGKTHSPEKKSLGYGLRNNPKKSSRFADPEFDSRSVVVQDRESETESRNPTRRRSKRNRKLFTVHQHHQEPKLKKPNCLEESSSTPPAAVAEPEPVSSVSDTSPEEDVAMCLMMLSRDVWMKDQKIVELVEESEEIKLMIPGKQNRHRCEKCKKGFRSYHALSGHKRICEVAAEKTSNFNDNAGKKVDVIVDEKIFQCPFCYKVFGSGQALGGHKRSHLLAAAANISSTAAAATHSVKFENNWIDLNLPAPLEDDEFSVISDA